MTADCILQSISVTLCGSISLMAAAALTSHALDLFPFLTLILCISAEAYIFLHQWEPTYYLLPLSWILLFPALQHLFRRSTDQVYVVDFSCFNPPSRFRAPAAALLEHLSLMNHFDRESIAFMAKVISSSGIGEETCFPPPLHYIPPQNGFRDSISEAEYLLFPILTDLLSKTGLAPTDIDILIVNCSVFCPSPSLASIIAHRFEMRDNVRTFNISGMGCSAFGVGIDIARGLLRGRRESLYALVLSTEVLSGSWYSGSDRRKLLVNCQFRSGSSAVLLTNRWDGDARRAPKYRLANLVRTHLASDDRSYYCTMQKEDDKGVTGFSIEGDVLHAVSGAVRSNLAAIGGLILPVQEKVRYVSVWLWWVISKKQRPAPVPDFGSAVQHFCLPSTGRRFIELIGKGLGLEKRGTEAARITLRRFGNQSSASVWYQLAYIEAKGRVGKGDKVWMLTLGSGLKCNSVVWECMRELVGEAERGPWAACINRYPTPAEDDDEEQMTSSTVGL